MEEIFRRLGGIRPVVGNTFFPMSEEEIAAIEAHLGVRLPPDYRSFLARYGASAFNEYIDYRPLIPFPREMYPSGSTSVGVIGCGSASKSLCHRAATAVSRAAAPRRSSSAGSPR